jgi:hypothetical protein
MAAAGTFTVRIQPTVGDDIEIPGLTMNTQVLVLKSQIDVKLRGIIDVHPKNIQLVYRTNRNNYKFLELIEGKLGEYGINFMDPDTYLTMVIGEPPRDYGNNSPQQLVSLLSNPTYLVDIPSNTRLASEVSPNLNFKNIYILNQPFDENHANVQKGLPCSVLYISPPRFLRSGSRDDYNKTIISVHNPDIRLSSSGDIKSSLLYDYIKDRRVAVEEEPIHGGRRHKRTRRTKRKLVKKRRTRRKHHKHRKH